MPIEGGEFWALGEEGGELRAFFVAQVVGVAHHPAGDLPDARWCRGDNTDASAAPRPQAVADRLVAAAVAELLELGVEMDRVGESCCPAFVQVGLVGVELAGPGLATPAQ
ncbi:hypothetical protein GCM10011579_067990 [Streptomyces albiflavescens]|uniref:Uncharacterized protein n=1 Tax=Streptomyces albiflavescens TaxID=1623582 RepID=A0A917YCB9_9ACTN|nr:hypothetical protein GCM10011579_067990 [Streptomyces albiflavescens]